ncbi:universal stress protein [Haloechinothrix sp. YIM 98757]|uniref:Universal stress protein n=1 Tax=Haloechinothrix aidingensis TaxID=2752311 RepID=A0A838ACJ2_9PSEU|nr:universal stress protein [Haloechinothrix aidingensis]MBA0126888.1 universal stress protein [Haloechinothrix aidingensis]
MTSNAHARHTILVGVDGSDSARRAACWGAREARRRGAVLSLVHVCYIPDTLPRYPAPPKERFDEAMVEAGESTLAEAKDAALAEALDIQVETNVRIGPVAATLVAESKNARLVVLGSRGLGGFAGLLVGSVGVTLAAHGECPVVVVPKDGDGRETPADVGLGDVDGAGCVVVGIDGSRRSDPAVEFAFDAASQRGVPLVAVHVWNQATVDTDWPELSIATSHEEESQLESLVASERLAGWREKYPDVEVTVRIRRGKPAEMLLEEAGREESPAELIVVGSRGRGPLLGLGLGSVSQKVLHHAGVPVAIVRSGAQA